ncbi:MAG: PIN domain-containing protein [Gemmatimonadaceae bacterium]
MAAPTIVEAAAVMLAKKGPVGEIALDALLQRLGIEVVPMSVEAAVMARSAYQRFGRGVGSPAVLNHADCLSYGVAMASAEPLLFKGEDFSDTDVPGRAVLTATTRAPCTQSPPDHRDGNRAGQPALQLAPNGVHLMHT